MFRGICVSLLFIASVGRADVIHSEPVCIPMNCAPGTVPAGGGHGACPSECSPNRVCANDAQCRSNAMGRAAPDATCIETRFCLRDQSTPRGRMYQILSGEPIADGMCARGTYSAEKRCHFPPAPTPAPAPATMADPSPMAEPASMTASEANTTSMSSAMSTETTTTEDAEAESCAASGGPSGAFWLLLLLAFRRRRR